MMADPGKEKRVKIILCIVCLLCIFALFAYGYYYDYKKDSLLNCGPVHLENCVVERHYKIYRGNWRRKRGTPCIVVSVPDGGAPVMYECKESLWRSVAVGDTLVFVISDIKPGCRRAVAEGRGTFFTNRAKY